MLIYYNEIFKRPAMSNVKRTSEPEVDKGYLGVFSLALRLKVLKKQNRWLKSLNETYYYKLLVHS